MGMFLELSKTFDTINHKTLFTKLYRNGVRGNAHRWFESNLSNRKQHTESRAQPGGSHGAIPPPLFDPNVSIK